MVLQLVLYIIFIYYFLPLKYIIWDIYVFWVLKNVLILNNVLYHNLLWDIPGLVTPATSRVGPPRVQTMNRCSYESSLVERLKQEWKTTSIDKPRQTTVSGTEGADTCGRRQLALIFDPWSESDPWSLAICPQYRWRHYPAASVPVRSWFWTSSWSSTDIEYIYCLHHGSTLNRIYCWDKLSTPVHICSDCKHGHTNCTCTHDKHTTCTYVR
jgi:hypothetical protein